ncbi:MAG: hypothetical protein PWQ27_414 [Kosmotoga sp.]|nr:hypothetical protein [Thermotogaceae bacterium]MDK2953031.1 hypothetical protein [Kosmotoga sp.]
MNLHIVVSGALYKHGGGVDTWAGYFIPNIRKHFDKVYIYCTKPFPDRQGELQEFYDNNVEVLRVSDPKAYLFIKNAPSFLEERYRKGDIVLAIGTLVSGWVAYKIKNRMKDANIVGWARGIPHREKLETKGILKSFIYKKLERKFIKKMDVLIANGADTAEYYNRFSPRSRIFVVPNAVDINKFKCAEISEFSNPIKVGFYGRFVKAKGFNYFLELVDDKSLNGDFLIRAWGWSESQDFDDKEWYMGFYNSDEVHKVLLESDIVLLLNSSKGAFGGGVSHLLLESMAAARLIIAWDNKIHCQVLNEANAILVREGDLEALKNVLLEIHSSVNKDAYKILCLNAKRDAGRYSIDEHIKKFLNVLREMNWI